MAPAGDQWHLPTRQTLTLSDERLTLADISVSYPLHLVGMLGIDDLLGPRAVAYRERLRARPAHQRAIAVA
jgi:glutathione S-transferase